jgi:hypothetical protein
MSNIFAGWKYIIEKGKRETGSVYGQNTDKSYPGGGNFENHFLFLFPCVESSVRLGYYSPARFGKRGGCRDKRGHEVVHGHLPVPDFRGLINRRAEHPSRSYTLQRIRDARRRRIFFGAFDPA